MARHEFQPGVPLGELVGKANLMLCCKRCTWRETYDIEAVIARLLARAVNGPLIGICAAAHHARKYCPHCGSNVWETRPDYGPYKPPGGDHGRP